MEKIQADILILGAGWSGLVAADILSRSNKKIVILEKGPDIGGLARTIDFKGFKFDLGGHRLYFKEKENIDYLKGILGEDGLVRLKRNSKIFFDNKYIDYPASLSSIFHIDKKYIINILFDMFRPRARTKQDNFQEWVMANYGECLYQIYFKDYTEKVWGERCVDLSSDWADKRIGNNNLFSLFRNIFISGYKVKDAAPSFVYPKKGLGYLVDSLEKRISNCRIYKNVRLGEISCEDGRLDSVSFVSGNEVFDLSFKEIISTIPIKELIAILPGVAEDIKQKASKEVKYRSLILAGLVIRQRLVTDWHWCYFPSRDIIFSRIHEPKFWVKGMAPEEGTLICMEIFCNYGDSTWNTGESEIIKKITDGLFRTGLLKDKNIIADARIEKIEYAYPLHFNGFEKPLAEVKDFLRSFKNLNLLGRSGTHSYFDMEECFGNVRDAINNRSA